ncbi:MAG TPA: arylesterase [Planctomycetota bacterium]|nr:arylesterase [Planctomycetota bacterium]
MRWLLLLAMACTAYGTETLVCLGDSLTAGFGIDEAQAFPAKLQELITADGLDWKVVNAGVSGDTTAGGLGRIAWVLKSKPTLVLVALGGNDGLRGIKPSAMRANLEKICDRLIRAKARPVIAGMQMPVNLGDDYRTAFAEVFPAVAAKKEVPLLPFLLEGVGGVAELNQADGIHPTAEGHARMAAHVYAFLKPHLQPR